MGSIPRLQWTGKWKHTVYKARWQMHEVEMGRVIKPGWLGNCLGWRRAYIVAGLAAQCCASACMSIDCVQGLHSIHCIHTYIHTSIRVYAPSHHSSHDSELAGDHSGLPHAIAITQCHASLKTTADSYMHVHVAVLPFLGAHQCNVLFYIMWCCDTMACGSATGSYQTWVDS